MKTKSLFLTLLALVVATGLTAKVKKIGMIGLDTSHSIAFVKSFNDKSGPHAGLGEYRVVAAYPHGSYTIPSSYERIPAYTDSVKKYGVEIVGSIDDLLKQVDYVLLETNDGNMHLEQAAQVMKAGVNGVVFARIGQAEQLDKIARRDLQIGHPFFPDRQIKLRAALPQAFADGSVQRRAEDLAQSQRIAVEAHHFVIVLAEEGAVRDAFQIVHADKHLNVIFLPYHTHSGAIGAAATAVQRFFLEANDED